jgi:hypothetical protein
MLDSSTISIEGSGHYFMCNEPSARSKALGALLTLPSLFGKSAALDWEKLLLPLAVPWSYGITASTCGFTNGQLLSGLLPSDLRDLAREALPPARYTGQGSQNTVH